MPEIRSVTAGGFCFLLALVLLASVGSVGAEQSLDDPPGDRFIQENKLSSGRARHHLSYARDRILVRFKEGTSQSAMASVHTMMRGTEVRKFDLVENLQVVELPEGVSVSEAIGAYSENPEVLYAEPDYVVEAHRTPDDPSFTSQWALIKTSEYKGINARRSWNITTGSRRMVVAVIDTGVDYTHEDLAANIWRNKGECRSNGIDDDENGYIDDCHGIDTINHDSDPMDDHNHGTHVAGIIGAVGNNQIGVAGVNWKVSILPCKFLDSEGRGTVSGAIGCFQYVTKMKDRGVNIVATNNSWGGLECSRALHSAIKAHMKRGILCIASSGNYESDNDQLPSYPASYYLPNVISVTSSSAKGRKSNWANNGRRTVHIGAPGEKILSTTIGNTYSAFSGTSMASPHVAGVAALLYSQDPTRDWRTVKNLIISGGDPVPRSNDPGTSLYNTISQRRLNAYGSLTCSDSIVLTRLLPIGKSLGYKITNTLDAAVGAPIDLSVMHIKCGLPNGEVDVVVSPTGATIHLKDDGMGADQAAGDGIYSGRWTPRRGGTFTLTFPSNDIFIVEVDPDLKPGFPLKTLHLAGASSGGQGTWRWATSTKIQGSRSSFRALQEAHSMRGIMMGPS